MSSEAKPNLWRRMSALDRVIATALVVMAVAILALSLLERSGLYLIQGALTVYLPLSMLFMLLGWGAYALHRRIKKHRTLATVIMVVVLFLLLTVVFSYVSFVTAITVPRKYAYSRSPSGAREIVILQGVDVDEARMELRRQARLEADPDSDPEMGAADMGYSYAAYPRRAAVFYNRNANAEGEVAIAVDSEASLMIEWLEDETVAHLFVKDPGPGDGGDWYLRFDP